MRKYWIGLDSKRPDAIVCTTKSKLAKFFCVSTKTIDRWLKAGECTEGRYIFHKPIQKLLKDPSNNLGEHKSSWKRADKSV